MPLTHSRSIRLTVSLVLLVLAAVGYLLFVKQTVVEPSRAGALIVDRTGLSQLPGRPSHSEVVPADGSSLKAVKDAARDDRTAGYVKVWSGKSSTGEEASILVAALPTIGQAKKAQSEADGQYLHMSAAELTSDHLSVSGRFGVPGVPGAAGVAYSIAKSSTTKAGTLDAVVLRQGRIVAVGYIESTSKGLVPADVQRLARAEDSRLAAVGPAFTQVGTTWPLVTSLVYWAVALVVALAVPLVPEGLARRRHRRERRRAERARYEYRARGRKDVRRHRAPEWARPRR